MQRLKNKDVTEKQKIEKTRETRLASEAEAQSRNQAVEEKAKSQTVMEKLKGYPVEWKRQIR